MNACPKERYHSPLNAFHEHAARVFTLPGISQNNKNVLRSRFFNFNPLDLPPHALMRNPFGRLPLETTNAPDAMTSVTGLPVLSNSSPGCLSALLH
ncbi:hypothetical protein BW686_06090 [Pseudomonas syringae]|uniref:Uncharacterized protein n=1 Tax=Pseudomonas syringae TaxID=317 RepID=A0A244EUW1_PSESX|nr:hypothetical protein [Pseudomonas syringae]OUM08242.1 hypothetical protein BW686_06090 [Pseudomonas syringae]